MSFSLVVEALLDEADDEDLGGKHFMTIVLGHDAELARMRW